MYVFLFLVKVTEWPPSYWENSCSFGLRYVSWYKYLIASLGFSHLGFWSGNLFLIALFPDLCLLVPFNVVNDQEKKQAEINSNSKNRGVNKIEIGNWYLHAYLKTHRKPSEQLFTSIYISRINK